MGKKKAAKKPKTLKDKAKAKENPRTTLVYAGVVLDGKGVVFHVYHEVPDLWESQDVPDRRSGFEDDPEGKRTRWFKKRFGWATPGTIITIEYDAKEPGSVYGSTAKRVGTYDDDTCTQWDAASRAVEDAKAALAAQKKAAKGDKDAFANLLEPIRKAYHQCRNEQQRVAILARVQAIITKFKPSDMR